LYSAFWVAGDCRVKALKESVSLGEERSAETTFAHRGRKVGMPGRR
jgi:hypothetical protein